MKPTLLEHFMPDDVVRFCDESSPNFNKTAVVLSASLHRDDSYERLLCVRYQVLVPAESTDECRVEDLVLSCTGNDSLSLQERCLVGSQVYDGSPGKLPIRLGCRVRDIHPDIDASETFVVAGMYLQGVGQRVTTDTLFNWRALKRFAAESPIVCVVTYCDRSFNVHHYAPVRLETLPSYYAAAKSTT